MEPGKRTVRGWIRQTISLWVLAGVVLAGSFSNLVPSTQAQIPIDIPNTTISGRVALFADSQAGEASVTVELYRLNLNGSRTLIKSATTSSNGSYSIGDVGAGLYRLIPRKRSGPAAFTFTPSSSDVFVRGAALTKNFTAHQPTIVVLGGWLGFSGPPRNCPIITYDPAICPEDQFDAYSRQPNSENLINELRAAGYYVETAALNSSSESTPSIRNQVPILSAAIDRAIAATGARKVVIIAHSMGGIVARRYVEGDNYRGDVSHLFTFGSPHRGAFLIDSTITLVALTFPPFGTALAAAGTAGLCGIQPAACDVSSAGMALYNLTTPPNSQVTYHIIHGDSLQSEFPCGIIFTPPCDSNDATLTTFGRGMDAAMTAFTLGQGVDPFIPTDSINGISGSRDRLKTHDAHDPGMGNPWYMSNVNKTVDGKRISRRSQSYTNCFKPVFLDRTTTTCGTVRSPNVPVLAQTDEDMVFQQVSSVTGTLQIGEHVSRTVQLVSSEETARFFTAWNTGTLSMKLQAPDGTLIDPTIALTDTEVLTYTSGDTFASYTLLKPDAYGLGTYVVLLEAVSGPVDAIDFETGAVFPSPYTFTVSKNRNWYPPGSAAAFTATFTGTNLTNRHVTGVVKRADGTRETINLEEQTPGTFALSYTIPDSTGYATVDFLATGDTPQGSIERVRSFQFQIYPDSFVPTGNFITRLEPAQERDTSTDETEETEETPLVGSDLVIQVEVQSPVAGDGRISGILSDAEGTVLLTSSTEATIPANTPTLVDLRFSGADLLLLEKPGPYTLSRLIVIDERSEALVSADITDVMTTPAFELSDFLPRVYVPLIVQ